MLYTRSFPLIILRRSFSVIILTHSRGFSFLTFLCALSFGLGDFTRIYSQRRTVRCALFTPLSLYPSLSFPLSIPLYPSLSLSLSFCPSLSLSLSYPFLPLYIFPSTFLSLSFLLSLFSLSFSLAYLMDVFVLVLSINVNITLQNAFFVKMIMISKVIDDYFHAKISYL